MQVLRGGLVSLDVFAIVALIDSAISSDGCTYARISRGTIVHLEVCFDFDVWWGQVFWRENLTNWAGFV